MENREWVGNKNRFVDTCNELGLGLLQTHCCEPEQQFVDIERRLDPQVGYIIKPATDRTRFEDQRRRFYRLPDVAALQQFMASDVGQAMIGECTHRTDGPVGDLDRLVGQALQPGDTCNGLRHAVEQATALRRYDQLNHACALAGWVCASRATSVA